MQKNQCQHVFLYFFHSKLFCLLNTFLQFVPIYCILLLELYYQKGGGTLELYLDDDSLPVYKALASETRIEILNNLANTPLTVSELAKSMKLSKAIISRHMKLLEDANLIHQSETHTSSDNRKKIFSLSVDLVEINFPKKIYLPFKKKTSEIKLGYFSDFFVSPTCGLASKDSIIGDLDDPRAFVSNDRVLADLLWFSNGHVEYKIPNLLNPTEKPELLELSLELSSEFPVSNNNWPSDISFTINDVEVGVWTSPGNYSDVRGKLTPLWWNSHYSQYGLLKHLRINNEDTGIDGHKLSSINLKDLHLNDSPFINLRIGICETAQNKGGLTIFGENFGNHPQNILLSLYYSEHI